MNSKTSFLAVVVAIFFFSGSSFAQEADTMAYKHYEFGPYASLGASVFKGDVPDGSKTDIHFPAFGVGATGIYSFHPYWGFALSIGYDGRGMWFKEQNVDEPNEDISLSYLSIAPSIKFKQFLLGVNINIPLGISVEHTGTPEPKDLPY